MSEKFLEAVRKGLEERDRQKGRVVLSDQDRDAVEVTDDIVPTDNSSSTVTPAQARAQPIVERVEAGVVCDVQLSRTERISAFGDGSEAREVEVRVAARGKPADLIAASERAISTTAQQKSRSCGDAGKEVPIVEVVDGDSDDEVIDLTDPGADDTASRERSNVVESSGPSRLPVSQPACPVPSLSFDDDDDLDLIAPLHDEVPQTEPLPIPLKHDVHEGEQIAALRDCEVGSANDRMIAKRKLKAEEAERAPKQQKVEKAPKEKRGVRTRGYPSRAALDRLTRSSRHRLFLVDKKDEQDRIACAVMGSNGNIYKCQISVQPSCECPDFQKRKGTKTEGPCKHLIFLYLRVLKVPKEDSKWWQTRLLLSELKEIMENAPKGLLGEPGVMAEDAVRERYHESSQEPVEKGRRPLEGECTICYEDLVRDDGNQQPDEETTYCKKCGNNFHSMCMQNWHRAQRNPTCPLCRESMTVEGSGKCVAGEGFLNLAQYSTTHERQLTLAELYEDTHQYIGNGRFRGGFRGRNGRARGRGRGKHTTYTG